MVSNPSVGFLSQNTAGPGLRCPKSENAVAEVRKLTTRNYGSTDLSDQDVQQGGLPCPGRADDRQNLPRVNRTTDPLQNLLLPVLFAHQGRPSLRDLHAEANVMEPKVNFRWLRGSGRYARSHWGPPELTGSR